MSTSIANVDCGSSSVVTRAVDPSGDDRSASPQAPTMSIIVSAAAMAGRRLISREKLMRNQTPGKSFRCPR
ncbi:hypothetical protein Aco03nite_055620 [Actinoplanes couchii]|uniref:Uncharacterized protein n=1 Tax=Actinoplanes couchii TaxID=403638 RepID=A0ABQ3XF86_9ACTN|nr:hypothetical protein Aco03nite_055620 [Actinoplanes couchii]